MRLIAETLQTVTPSPLSAKPWKERVVLGCWATKYLPLAHHYLPGYPVSHIGFSTSYARQFFDVPNISFNMLIPILQAPGGRKFIKEVQARKRPIFAWTVNSESRMEWCIRRKLDGVITDDPKLFLEVCKKHDESKAEPRVPLADFLNAIRIWLFALVFGAFYRSKFAKLKSSSPMLASRTPAAVKH